MYMAVRIRSSVQSLATAVRKSVDVESDRVASVMCSIKSTEPDLYEELMNMDSAITNLMRFVQLSVRCNTEQHHLEGDSTKRCACCSQ